ncbi:MAG: hypothetical protein WC091_26370, partial [Sulfuricellaceae bacterium]
TAMGGGAMIVDKYPRTVEEYSVPSKGTGSASIAETKSDAPEKTKVKAGQRHPAASEVACAA